MVNVSDVENERKAWEGISNTDDCFLRWMFGEQEELMRTYHFIEKKTLPCVVPEKVPVDLDSYHGQHCLRWLIRNAITELSEADDCLKNKAWKKTMIETDVTHLKEEMADALHFFIESCLLIGMDAKELFEFYMKKNAVNKFRQRSEY